MPTKRAGDGGSGARAHTHTHISHYITYISLQKTDFKSPTSHVLNNGQLLMMRNLFIMVTHQLGPCHRPDCSSWPVARHDEQPSPSQVSFSLRSWLVIIMSQGCSAYCATLSILKSGPVSIKRTLITHAALTLPLRTCRD